jgi:beta-mannosidase
MMKNVSENLIAGFLILFAVLATNYTTLYGEERPHRKIGGFRCVDLLPHTNDTTFNLYDWGAWSFSGFKQDIWKRHGVPFWYKRGTNTLKVAGGGETGPREIVIPLNGTAAEELFALGHVGVGFDTGDDVLTPVGEYLLAYEDGRHEVIELIAGKNVADVRYGHFVPEAVYAYGFVDPSAAAADITYSANTGSRVGIGAGNNFSGNFTGRIDDVRFYEQELSAEEIGELVNPSNVNPLSAEDDVIGMQPAVWFELESGPEDTLGKRHGTFAGATIVADAERGQVMELIDGQSLQVDYAIPPANTTVSMWFKTSKGGSLIFSSMGNGSDKDLHIGRKDHGIGGAVESFIWQSKVSFIDSGAKDYRDGKWHHVARTVGPGGHNLYLDGVRVTGRHESSKLNYHLGEMLEVEPKLQLMRFEHKLAYPGSPLKSLTFRCTRPETELYLLALTLRQSGPRIHAITYNGRQLDAYPADTPRAEPSKLDALRKSPRRMSLDGPWQFRTDPGNQGMRKKWYAIEHLPGDWQEMPVPSQWYVQGVDYHGIAWYRRDFKVPGNFASPVYELNFDRVDYDARVWVNGEYAGRHVGAFSAFKLDVSKWIKKGKKNTVVVRVDSPIDPGYSGGHKSIIKGNSMDDIPMPYGEEGCMGGIYRSVSLTRRGKLGIENTWTHCKVSKDLSHAEVTVNFELSPSRKFRQNVNIRCRLREPKAGGRVFKINRKVAIEGMERTLVELKLSIDDPMLWTVWEQGTPHLHLLEIRAGANDQTLDKHFSRVGIREFGEVHKEYYTLNHHRVFVKGMLNDDVHWQSMMDRTGYRQRIQLQQDANLNLIRLIGHQSSPDFYDLCDEMGMLVWQEMPLQWVYSSSEPVREDILAIAGETIVQTRPHACVMGYTGWNEGGQMGFTEKLMKRIRGLDPTRPVWAASGGTGWGDKDGWNIHIYPNLSFNLSRRTPFWFGINSGFVSEVGAYGLSSLEEMHEIMGDELFPFDSASFYWDNFSTYRWSDSMIFMDKDAGAVETWSTDQMRDYTLSKIDVSERWLFQFMKSTYENFRAQRFDKSSGVIHCRFDDAFPTAFLGVVNFNGRPRKSYYGVQQACQQVLPIMYFDCVGVKDIRVINEYWEKSWDNCTLTYKLKNRQGEIVIDKQQRFDLDADATVKVLSREQAGDVWMMDGFSAELSVSDSGGVVLSSNSYDFKPEEVRDFITSVYPLPPNAPVDAQMILAADTKSRSGATEIPAEGKKPIYGPYHAMASTLAEEFYDPIGTYSEMLVKLEGEKPHLTYRVDVKETGVYYVRMSCDSGKIMREYELQVDGQKAALEQYPSIDITRGLTRVAYYGNPKSSGDYDLTGSGSGLSWRPGWKVRLTTGPHTLEFIWPNDQSAPVVLLDAFCLQKIE